MKKRRKYYQFSITEDFIEICEAEAKARGLSVGQFARECLLTRIAQSPSRNIFRFIDTESLKKVLKRAEALSRATQDDFK